MANRIIHFDCFSGAAGDMILGALIDAGFPPAVLHEALGPLALDVDLRIDRVVRGGITSTAFSVVDRQPPASHPHRHLKAIVALVDRAAASAAARARAVALLTRLAEVEAGIHGTSVERVHLHEVGGTDSIVDVLGAAVAFEWFGAVRVTCSPINVGSGTVHTAHGLLPVPAPATTRLIEGVPIFAEGVPMERLTPTGALLLTGYASAFGGPPPMRVTAIGHGAGSRETPGIPNVLRVLVGDETDASDEAEETVTVLECQVDDASPQVLGAFVERALGAGALDVFFTPVQMKKNRPGTLLTVIAAPADRARLAALMFQEVPTLGVRYHEERRQRLARHHHTVTTAFGEVRVKVGQLAGQVVNAAPEFEDCARLAREHSVPVREVMAAALHAWRTSQSPV